MQILMQFLYLQGQHNLSKQLKNAVINKFAVFKNGQHNLSKQLKNAVINKFAVFKNGKHNQSKQLKNAVINKFAQKYFCGYNIWCRTCLAQNVGYRENRRNKVLGKFQRMWSTVSASRRVTSSRWFLASRRDALDRWPFPEDREH
ncbi:uncharacterized protein LOC143265341 isoform X2 [Megachile rotundata]|uniref:uncharacterized protein LOC143265341 isoform X2 n=1 Tax=Megachile rotundata TaxID=143995 RepID=UPI003FD30A50